MKQEHLKQVKYWHWMNKINLAKFKVYSYVIFHRSFPPNGDLPHASVHASDATRLQQQQQHCKCQSNASLSHRIWKRDQSVALELMLRLLHLQTNMHQKRSRESPSAASMIQQNIFSGWEIGAWMGLYCHQSQGVTDGPVSCCRQRTDCICIQLQSDSGWRSCPNIS